MRLGGRGGDHVLVDRCVEIKSAPSDNADGKVLQMQVVKNHTKLYLLFERS